MHRFNLDMDGGTYNLRIFNDDGTLNEVGRLCQSNGTRSDIEHHEQGGFTRGAISTNVLLLTSAKHLHFSWNKLAFLMRLQMFVPQSA